MRQSAIQINTSIGGRFRFISILNGTGDSM